ncbi:MAG: hypothetical protein ACKO7N_08060, partial [Candidatus Nitrosotenuis sp.]
IVGAGSVFNGYTGTLIPTGYSVYFHFKDGRQILFFNNATLDGDWNTLGNWWVDSDCTLGGFLPQFFNDAVVFGRGDENTETEFGYLNLINSGSDPTLNNLSLYNVNPYTSVLISIECGVNFTVNDTLTTSISWLFGNINCDNIISGGSGPGGGDSGTNFGGTVNGNITGIANFDNATINGNVNLSDGWSYFINATVNGNVTLDNTILGSTGSLTCTGTVIISNMSDANFYYGNSIICPNIYLNNISPFFSSMTLVGDVIATNCSFEGGGDGSILGNLVLNNGYILGYNITGNAICNNAGLMSNVDGDAVLNGYSYTSEPINITNSITFNDYSSNQSEFSCNNVTFNGNSSNTLNYWVYSDNDIIFNDSSINYGNVTGTAIFNHSSFGYPVENGATYTNGAIFQNRTPYPLKRGVNSSILSAI